MKLAATKEDAGDFMIRLPGTFTDHRDGVDYTISELGDFDVEAVEIELNMPSGRQALRLVNAKDGSLHWMCV